MQDTITYNYNSPSSIVKTKDGESLFLEKFSEIEKQNEPTLFWGRLTNPFITAKALITLSSVVQSSFNLSTPNLRDPIVSVGNDVIRFEGFSHCAGVYAKVDVLPDGHDGELIASGTTNVDFNPPMIAALGSFNKRSKITLSVGKDSVGMHYKGKNVVERKVPLPTKWIKGLTAIQIYMAESEQRMELNKRQAIDLFRSIPKGKTKADYYLVKRGQKAMFTPVKSRGSVAIGAIYRLQLIEQLIPLIDKMIIFAHPNMQSTTWQLYFGSVRFSLSISRENWRGFSGEGAGLEALLEDVPDSLLSNYDKLAYANHTFDPKRLAGKTALDAKTIKTLSTKLSAMGLLGYDLDNKGFFYRRLPFKMSRILQLNPRLKGVATLIAEGKVIIVKNTTQYIEAKIAGSGVAHTVIISNQKAKCTCTWFAKHQGERGFCKHILATKKILQND